MTKTAEYVWYCPICNKIDVIEFKMRARYSYCESKDKFVHMKYLGIL